jgi:DNA polymerase elongation subunit (family B)
MISGLYRSKGLLDRANNRSQQAYETFCRKSLASFINFTFCLVMTNPKKGVIPLSFDAQLKNAKINPESVKKFINERVLLNSFFAKLKQLDPDIVIVSSELVLSTRLLF